MVPLADNRGGKVILCGAIPSNHGDCTQTRIHLKESHLVRIVCETEEHGVVVQNRELGPALDRESSVKAQIGCDREDARRAKQGDAAAALPASHRTKKKRNRWDTECPHRAELKKWRIQAVA